MPRKINLHVHRAPWARRWSLVGAATVVLGLGIAADTATAWGQRFGGRFGGRPAFGVRAPGPARGFGDSHGALGGQQGREFGRQPGSGLQGRGFGRGQFGRPGAFAGGLARNGLPRRPFPGEFGFTGVPPSGERRFIADEMIVHVGPEVSPQVLDAAARRLGMTAIDSQNLAITGGRIVQFRLAGGLEVSDAIRALEAEQIGIAQPNYVFQLQQDAPAAPSQLLPKGDPSQYVVAKLQLVEAHRLATGANVPVAVIDSQVDATHPDLAGAIVAQFDAVGGAADKPDEHGTGMAGAIAAHRKLLGVAPRARILAVRAFSPHAQTPQQATSRSIVAGIDWAIEQGARVINMSFAGPYDPVLQVALKKAHDKGVVLIAAAGNMGPQSPPLYPAADENVIAVTAVDQNDHILPQANQGPHIAVAAPGVSVIETAPRGTYNLTSGTSIAAAHVSGVAALLIERNPAIDIATLENVLTSTAKDLGAPGRDDTFGYGLVGPYRALTAAGAPEVASSGPRRPSGSLMPVTVATSSEKLPLGPSALAPGPASAPTGSIASPSSVKPAAPPRLSELAPGPAQASPPASPAVRPAPSGAATAAAGEPQEVQAAVERKRQACRQEMLGKGVRGQEAVDQITLCVAEARLACLRQAVAQQVRGPERREFMTRCLAGS